MLRGFGLMSMAGGLAGTVAGIRLARRLPEQVFRRSVAVLLLLLGLMMLRHAE